MKKEKALFVGDNHLDNIRHLSQDSTPRALQNRFYRTLFYNSTPASYNSCVSNLLITEERRREDFHIADCCSNCYAE